MGMEWFVGMQVPILSNANHQIGNLFALAGEDFLSTTKVGATDILGLTEEERSKILELNGRAALLRSPFQLLRLDTV